MMKFTRKWRKSRPAEEPFDGDGDGGEGCSLPTRDDFRPIDTRGVCTAFLLFYAGFLVYSICQQVRHPWELRYHAYFMDDVDSLVVVAADCTAVFACLIAIKGLLQDPRSHLQWLQCSCFVGAGLAIFWLYHMMRWISTLLFYLILYFVEPLPRFRWDIIWLPLGPFSGALVCLYVEHLLAESLEDIRKLRGSMY